MAAMSPRPSAWSSWTVGPSSRRRIPHPPAGFFSTEAAGLRWLVAADAVRVPMVLAVSDGDPPPFLVLEWVDVGPPRPATEAQLGRALARLHLAVPACFGREDRRTTGSRGLPNEPLPTWPEFYGTQRLAPLARLARKATAPATASPASTGSPTRPPRRFGGADEPPARLHGDLWAGNRLVDERGDSWLIDPAAHGGHREFDLAMMRLFGGFGDACFAAYAEVHPLAAGLGGARRAAPDRPPRGARHQVRWPLRRRGRGGHRPLRLSDSMTWQVIAGRARSPKWSHPRRGGPVTAIHPDLSPASTTPTPQSAARRRLQDLVRADAIVCAVSGFALLAAADVLGTSPASPRPVPCAPSARSWSCSAWGWRGWDRRVMTPGSGGPRSSAAGDIVWALASFAVAFVADLSGPGRALILVQGVLVLAIGEAKLVLRRRAGDR